MQCFKLILAWLLFISFHAFSQNEFVDTSIINKIKQEGLINSQVMNIAFNLTDVSGPRLTNSPGYKRAAGYAIKKFESWGLKNIKHDPFKFGKSWELKRAYVAMKAPYYKPVYGIPRAWTIGTNGPIVADLLLVNAENFEELEDYKVKMKGKLLILESRTIYTPTFKPDATRFSDSLLKTMQAKPANASCISKPVTQISARIENYAAYDATFYAYFEKMALKYGAAGVLSFSRGGHDGTIFVVGMPQLRSPASTTITNIMIPLEDYLTTLRLLRAKIPVKYELNIEVDERRNELQGFNVLAEIPGEDPVLKSEVVMLGGHLDSWHGGTGATDNAAGVAVAMEAVRIIKQLGLHPKRTIRIGLWGGEEQGLLGSNSYVRKTFYDSTTGKQLPAYNKLSAYFNHDFGAGKIRGIYLQNREATRSIFEAWLKPFSEFGANTITAEPASATDHASFDRFGLPGFQFIQDPLEYSTRTHHSSVDTYDHLIPEDLKLNSVIMAAFVYLAATRDTMMPRQ